MKTPWVITSILATAGIINLGFQVGRYEQQFFDTIAQRAAPAIAERVAHYVEGELEMQYHDTVRGYQIAMNNLQREDEHLKHKDALLSKKIKDLEQQVENNTFEIEKNGKQ